MYAALRKGKTINNGDYMAKSTLVGIMGREATYSGQAIKWDELLASDVSLAPAKYAWGPLPMAPIAVPGRRDKA
jgi:hypothetical protein